MAAFVKEKEKEEKPPKLKASGIPLTVHGSRGWFNLLDHEGDFIGGFSSPLDAFTAQEALRLYSRTCRVHPMLAGFNSEECISYAQEFQNGTQGHRGASIFVDGDFHKIDVCFNSPAKVLNARDKAGIQWGHRLTDILKGSLKRADRMFIVLSQGEADPTFLQQVLGSSLNVMPVYTVYFTGKVWKYSDIPNKFGYFQPLLRTHLAVSANVSYRTMGQIAFMSADQRSKLLNHRNRTSNVPGGLQPYQYQKINSLVNFNGANNGILSTECPILQAGTLNSLTDEDGKTISCHLAGQNDCWASVLTAAEAYQEKGDPAKMLPVNDAILHCQKESGFLRFISHVSRKERSSKI